MAGASTSRALATFVLLTLALAPAADVGTLEDAFAAYDEAIASKDPDHEGYARAYGIWVRLARDGDAAARYHLGLLHYFGLGGAELNHHRSAALIRDAATAGYPTAQSFLAFLHERGDGSMVVLDDTLALQWYRRAAEGRHCVAIKRLAQAHAGGDLGLAADAEVADAWRGRLPGCRRR